MSKKYKLNKIQTLADEVDELSRKRGILNHYDEWDRECIHKITRLMRHKTDLMDGLILDTERPNKQEIQDLLAKVRKPK